MIGLESLKSAYDVIKKKTKPLTNKEKIMEGGVMEHMLECPWILIGGFLGSLVAFIMMFLKDE